MVTTGTFSGLTAVATSGDVNVNSVSGTLAINYVTSVSQGAINLSAVGNISVATGGLGLLTGGVMTLNTTGGGIGNSTTAPLELRTPNPVPGLVDTLTATAQTNVYLEEVSGDLRLNSLSTGGSVWIDVPNGSVLNANTNSTTDLRTEMQLADGVWTDLGLTSTTGYQQKINTTLASFVGQQNTQYQTYWTDIMSGNTSGAGFQALAAIFGPGGTYAAQDPSYNPNVYYGAAAVISAPAYFTGNTVNAPVYFTAGGPVEDATVYFTAGSGPTPGTITRTDGGSWLTQGFAVGQSITVTGSALEFDRGDVVHDRRGDRQRHHLVGRRHDPERRGSRYRQHRRLDPDRYGRRVRRAGPRADDHRRRHRRRNDNHRIPERNRWPRNL